MNKVPFTYNTMVWKEGELKRDYVGGIMLCSCVLCDHS